MKPSSQSLEERWKHRDMVAKRATVRPPGALVTASWLSARGLIVPPRTPWEVSIALDVVDEKAPAAFLETTATRFHAAIASGEWGFYFCHLGRASWIRVTDVPSVHERDEHALLLRVPPLRDLGKLVRRLEGTYCIRFRREHAAIRSTIASSEPAIWEWVLTEL